ncbi:MAG: hypothetical protein Q4B23_06270 [Helcococcus sp.]|nr:hypothetical protein [Helcococcus sp.]
MKYIKDFFYNFSDIIFALIIVVAIGFVLYTNLDYLVNVEEAQAAVETIKENESKEEVVITVTIPSGLNVEQLADLLTEYKVIENKEDFIKSFETTEKVSIKSGTYKFKQGENFDRIISTLIN